MGRSPQVLAITKQIKKKKKTLLYWRTGNTYSSLGFIRGEALTLKLMKIKITFNRRTEFED